MSAAGAGQQLMQTPRNTGKYTQRLLQTVGAERKNPEKIPFGCKIHNPSIISYYITDIMDYFQQPPLLSVNPYRPGLSGPLFCIFFHPSGKNRLASKLLNATQV